MAYKAILVGISEYEESLNNLPSVRNDLSGYYSILERSSSQYKIEIIDDKTRSADDIVSKLQLFFDECVEDDTVFMFWGGHGTYSSLLTYDSSVSFEIINALLSNCRASMLLAIFDACYSGNIEFTPSRAENSSNLALNINGEGKVVITSSSISQKSRHYEEEFGLLTHYVLEGLSGDASDELGNITVSTLFDYVCKKVNEYTAKRGWSPQTPVKMGLENGRILLNKIIDYQRSGIVNKNIPKRISLGIRSFMRGAKSMETDTEKMLCLLDKFSDRFIKDEYEWNEDILTVVNDFLSESVTQNEAYQLFLDTHSCVAFAAGRLFDTKMGVNIAPVQKTPNPVLWERDPLDESEYSTWDVRDERVFHDSFDTALIINITKDIYEEVAKYIEEESLSIGRIISCSICETQSSKYAIANGTHCAQLSCSIDSVLNSRTTKERRAKLHIFSSAPNAFMFHLGQNSRGFGKSIILYEYDFEQTACCTYYPTIQI